MNEEIKNYIGKTIDGVGFISGYNENDDTFTVRVTYCDHIKIKRAELTTFKIK